MALVKSNLPTFSSFPRLFDDFFTRDLFDFNNRSNGFNHTTVPSVNIVENHEGFSVEMAAPGMNKADFNIQLNNEVLTISSQKEWKNEINDNERYTRHEFSYQAFERSFHLPKSVVDDSKIKAEYKDGILRVLIPKKEEAKALPPRTIAVQ